MSRSSLKRSISFLLARDVTGRIGLGALPPFPVTRRGLAAVDDRALDADKNYNRSMLATSTMRHLGWLFLFVAAVAAMWWAGLKGIAVLVTLVCGLAGLAYLVVRARRPTPLLRAEQERDRHDVERYVPPGS
jgi:hypothetical protein